MNQTISKESKTHWHLEKQRDTIVHRNKLMKIMFKFSRAISQKNAKNLYMGILILLTTIGFNIMRGMRETVIFQFGKNGALYTPFIRIMCILPISALLFIYYLSIKKRTNTLIAYYALTIPLLVYFIVYGLFSVPGVINIQTMPVWVTSLMEVYPPIEFIGGIIVHWDKTLYYVFCEAWGSFTLVILFWQIANETYTPKQASKYYPIFSMLGGVGIIISSLLIKKMGKYENMTLITTEIITLIGICNLWLVSKIWHQKKDDSNIERKPKIAISMREGIKIALTTPHILYLTTCIISFSILCNVYENAVRNIILNHYGSEQEVFRFWGNFFFGKGLLVISANIISKALLRRVGWFYVAITTPVISIISIHLILSIPSFQIDPQVMANTQSVLWGLAILLQLNFAVKYAFFDPTKEMAYIPLSDEQQTYGKTVADGMGSRVGNISSGIVQSFAIIAAAGNDFTQVAPILLGICSLISLGWIWAMTGLSRTYIQMTSESNRTPLSLAEEKI